MRFIFVLSCLLVVFSIPALITPVFADLSDIKQEISPRELDMWKNKIPRFTKQYDDLVKKIYNHPKIIEDKVALLRSYYPRTEQYSPFSKSILDEITKYALILDDASDNEVINDDLMSYNALVAKHLMNFDVASFALTMSRVDVRFGDETFYKRIRDALINSFNKRGVVGKSAELAYEIISYGEETYILEQIGGKIESSEIYNLNKRYYNVHEIVDKDGGYRQVFMNVTQPIKNIFYNQIIKEQEEKMALTPR